MKKLFLLLISCWFVASLSAQTQDNAIGLFQQHNGRYNYTLIGNTLNPAANNLQLNFCHILSESAAELNLSEQQEIIAAYLYWSGSGPVDEDIALNQHPLQAQHSYSIIHTNNDLPFFVARAEITELVQEIGNGTYTFSELDISQALAEFDYCSNRTNYAGWAIVVVYHDENLPLNQLNIYDGFVAVPTEVNITLSNLNVVDQQGANIGFIAWEGDSDLAINETLRFNNNILSNPPLNPASNAFNSTNSFTGDTNLYNMDLDFYPIENFIQTGDTEASIRLTSGVNTTQGMVGDVVFISTVISVLNSQVPDASIALETPEANCQNAIYLIPYTISNTNSTNPLPVTEVGVYVQGQLVDVFSSGQILAINESISGIYELSYAATEPFEVVFEVDYLNQVYEISEQNNRASLEITPKLLPTPLPIADLVSCESSPQLGLFEWSEALANYQAESSYEIAAFWTQDDALANENPMASSQEYSANRTVYLRIENADCFVVIPWNWRLKKCILPIPNYFSVNADQINDQWNLTELLAIFPRITIHIYNRWGRLVWVNTPNDMQFSGICNQAGTWLNKELPTGTYFAVLHYNEVEIPEPSQHYLYLER